MAFKAFEPMLKMVGFSVRRVFYNGGVIQTAVETPFFVSCSLDLNCASVQIPSSSKNKLLIGTNTHPKIIPEETFFFKLFIELRLVFPLVPPRRA